MGKQTMDQQITTQDSAQKTIMHLSTYKFAPLADTQFLQQHYRKLCFQLQLKGAIVFTPEGTNIMMAGSIDNMQIFINTLAQDPRFKNLPNKINFCNTQPFKRLQVKIKKLLVPGIEAHTQQNHPAPYLTPAKLKQWIEQGHDDNGKGFTLLDTRNGFEFRKGAFKNTVHLDLQNFSDFSDAIDTDVNKNTDHILPKNKDTTIVTFCTGGIRCERGAPLLKEKGFNNVYQLQGGIIDYFKDFGLTDDQNFTGSCFVFDGRTAINQKMQQA